MCQINTMPTMNQIGYLEIGVPPDILYNASSTDMDVKERSNVLLHCEAIGMPTPNITWRREDSKLIILGNNQTVASIDGPVFNITKVNRLQMGAYLCIASNGMPPTVSKRIMLAVQFAPMISVQNQLVGAQEGHQAILQCYSEAFPKSHNYWIRENNVVITNEKYELSLSHNVYKVYMKLMIRSVAISDYGSYKCISKNSLGETDGNINLYHIPTPTTEPTTTSILPVPTTVEPDTQLYGRPSHEESHEAEDVITDSRKSVDSDVGQRRIDNTAKSMSSKSSTLHRVQRRVSVAICIIVLRAIIS